MPRLSFVQFAALILFAPLAMTACDIPIPAESSGTVTEPDLSGATVASGELTDSDGQRENGQKRDVIATVSIPAGGTLQAMMESDAFDTYLVVEVVGTAQTFTNDDFNGSQRRSFIAQTNPTAGSMDARIVASSYGSAARGAYSVRYLVTKPPKAPDARALSVPTTVSGTITASTPEVPLTSADAARRSDAYSFTLGTGQTATVRMESAAFDTYLKVLRNGTFEARNDDFGSRSVSQVSLSQPGSYTVLAGSFTAEGAGAYTLSVQIDGASGPAAPASGGVTPAASQGTVLDGAITDADGEVALTANNDLRKTDGYDVELRAGQTLVVEMESGSFDTYLKLVRGGTYIARNDDDGSTRRSAIRHTATHSGTYTVYAGTFTESGRGAYTLRWRVE